MGRQFSGFLLDTDIFGIGVIWPVPHENGKIPDFKHVLNTCVSSKVHTSKQSFRILVLSMPMADDLDTFISLHNRVTVSSLITSNESE